MTKNKTLHQLILFMILIALLLGACQPEPTPVPLAERDLSQAMLQQADLPAGFDTVIESNPDDVFPNAPAVHTGLVNGRTTIFKTSDDKHVFQNGVLVYDTEELASSAYQAIIAQAKGDKLTVETIGDETFAIYSTVSSDLILNTIHVAMILWRTGPAVVYLSSADSLNQPDPNQMPDLAKLIQSRLVGPTVE